MKKYRNFFRIEQIKKYLPLIILVCIHCRWLQVNVEIFGEIRQTEYSLSVLDYAISFFKGTVAPSIVVQLSRHKFNLFIMNRYM